MISRGFTIIELLVVLLVIGVVATIAFYGLSSNGIQPVINAQLEFLTNFRSFQNGVNQGANGLNYKYMLLATDDNKYTIYDNTGLQIGAPILLPAGVKIRLLGASNLAICVANPNMASYDGTANRAACWKPGCSTGTYFACQTIDPTNGPFNQIGGNNTPASITVQFYSGNITKNVIIEGTGMNINRIYAQ